ncbi:hypothetical protein GCM10009117_19560 [Gangjinia marincola]|uniref:Lipoprotein n=1 Tax=Gangjinia marincola TaxID=578463 RepID=A0ABP3XTS7_9FLAO
MNWKNVVAILFMVFVASCSLDDGDDFVFDVAPTISVDLPDSLQKGQTYQFKVIYERESTCQAGYGFNYSTDGNERFISVLTQTQVGATNCVENDTLTGIISLNFIVDGTIDDFYVFNFWQGEDEDGEQEYLSIEVPVKTD